MCLLLVAHSRKAGNHVFVVALKSFEIEMKYFRWFLADDNVLVG